MKFFKFFSTKKEDLAKELNFSTSNDILLNTNNKIIIAKEEENKEEKLSEKNSNKKEDINNKENSKEDSNNFSKILNFESNNLITNKFHEKNTYDALGLENRNYEVNKCFFNEEKNAQQPKEYLGNKNQNFIINSNTITFDNNSNNSSFKNKNEENNNINALSINRQKSNVSETYRSKDIQSKRSKFDDKKLNSTKNQIHLEVNPTSKYNLSSDQEVTEIIDSHSQSHYIKEHFLNLFYENNNEDFNFKKFYQLENYSGWNSDRKSNLSVNLSNYNNNNKNDKNEKIDFDSKSKNDNENINLNHSHNNDSLSKRENSNELTSSKFFIEKSNAIREGTYLNKNSDETKRKANIRKNKTKTLNPKPSKNFENLNSKLRKLRTDIQSKKKPNNDLESVNITKRNNSLSRIERYSSGKIIFKGFENAKKFEEDKDQLNFSSNFLKTLKSLKNKNTLEERKRRLQKRKHVYDSISENEDVKDKFADKNFNIHPNSVLKIFIDFCVLVALVYSLLYLPLRLIFSENSCLILFILELTFDIANIVDFFLTFIIGFYDFEENYITNKLEIFYNYLRTSFFVDILSGIPFNSLAELSNLNSETSLAKLDEDLFYQIKNIDSTSYWNNFLTYKSSNIVNIYRIFRVLKFVKVFSRNSFIDWVQKQMGLQYMVAGSRERMMFFFLYFLLMSHILTCIFIFLGSLEENNWIVFQKLQNTSFSDVYVASLYFNHLTIFTIGYGDILSKNLYERLYNIILMVVGIMLYSFTITSISNMIQQQDEKTKVYLKNMEYFNGLTIKYGIKRKLADKVSRYFKYNKNTDKNDKNDLLKELPLGLRNEMIVCMYKNIITSFVFFKNFNNFDFAIKAIESFKPVNSLKNEILVKEGENLEEIIFVKIGVLSLEVKLKISEYRDVGKRRKEKSHLLLNNVINNEEFRNLKIIEIRDNEHFGDVLLFLNERSPLSVRTRSKTAELFLMKKTALMDLSGEFPEIFQEIYNKSSFNMMQIKGFIKRSKIIQYRKINRNVKKEDLLANISGISDCDLDEELEEDLFGEFTLDSTKRENNVENEDYNKISGNDFSDNLKSELKNVRSKTFSNSINEKTIKDNKNNLIENDLHDELIQFKKSDNNHIKINNKNINKPNNIIGSNVLVNENIKEESKETNSNNTNLMKVENKQYHEIINLKTGFELNSDRNINNQEKFQVARKSSKETELSKRTLKFSKLKTNTKLKNEKTIISINNEPHYSVTLDKNKTDNDSVDKGKILNMNNPKRFGRNNFLKNSILNTVKPMNLLNSKPSLRNNKKGININNSPQIISKNKKLKETTLKKVSNGEFLNIKSQEKKAENEGKDRILKTEALKNNILTQIGFFDLQKKLKLNENDENSSKKRSKNSKKIELKNYPYKYVFNIDHTININNTANVIVNGNPKKENIKFNKIFKNLKSSNESSDSSFSDSKTESVVSKPVYNNPFSQLIEETLMKNLQVENQETFTISTDESSSKSKEKNIIRDFDKTSIKIHSQNTFTINCDYEKTSSNNINNNKINGLSEGGLFDANYTSNNIISDKNENKIRNDKKRNSINYLSYNSKSKDKFTKRRYSNFIQQISNNLISGVEPNQAKSKLAVFENKDRNNFFGNNIEAQTENNFDKTLNDQLKRISKDDKNNNFCNNFNKTSESDKEGNSKKNKLQRMGHIPSNKDLTNYNNKNFNFIRASNEKNTTSSLTKIVETWKKKATEKKVIPKFKNSKNELNANKFDYKKTNSAFNNPLSNNQNRPSGYLTFRDKFNETQQSERKNSYNNNINNNSNKDLVRKEFTGFEKNTQIQNYKNSLKALDRIYELIVLKK